MRQILIVGSGFAAIACARGLRNDKRVQITLISDRDNFEYRPTVYRQIGQQSNVEISIPLAIVFAGMRNLKLVRGLVTAIDPIAKTVRTKAREFGYDELVVAVGTATDFGTITGLDELSHTSGGQREARELRSHIDRKLSNKTVASRFVVVGAGVSGVELAADVAEYCRSKAGKPAIIDLVEAEPRILPKLPERISRRMTRRLEELHVKIYTNTRVKGSSARQLQLPEGSSQTVSILWAGGRAQNPLLAQYPKVFNPASGGQIQADSHLQAHAGIWVAGDCAATEHSGWASAAIYDGAFVAANIKRKLEGQSIREHNQSRPIVFVSAGKNWCLADMRSRRFAGKSGDLVRQATLFLLLKNVLPTRLAWQYVFNQRRLV